MKPVYFNLAVLLFLPGFAARSNDLDTSKTPVFSTHIYITANPNQASTRFDPTLNKNKVLLNCSASQQNHNKYFS